MIDIALLRRDPDRIRTIAARRTGEARFVDEAIAADAQRRAALTTAESLKAEKNALTRVDSPKPPTAPRRPRA